MLTGIVYYSEVTKHFSLEDLRSLCGQSDADNCKAGITGMLLYVEDHFLQYVEGEHDVLEALMVKIRADVRHSVLKEYQDDTLGSRRFPEWNMRWLLDKDLKETHLHEQIGACFLGDGYKDEATHEKAIWKLVDGLACIYKTLGDSVDTQCCDCDC